MIYLRELRGPWPAARARYGNPSKPRTGLHFFTVPPSVPAPALEDVSEQQP